MELLAGRGELWGVWLESCIPIGANSSPNWYIHPLVLVTVPPPTQLFDYQYVRNNENHVKLNKDVLVCVGSGTLLSSVLHHVVEKPRQTGVGTLRNTMKA
jgi:hypothetical protein